MPRGALAAWTALAICGVLGCLPAFAPNLRPRAQHSQMRPTSDNATCMGCHVSEREALARGGTMSAPIVADWMLDDRRTCVDCHRVATPRSAHEARP